MTPTLYPSPVPKDPTFEPTPGPTGEPTFAPTASTVVELQLNQVIQGVAASDFQTPNFRITFTKSVAAAMNINNNSVSIGNVTESSSSRRMSGFGIGSGLRASSAHPNHLLTATTTLNIDYSVILIIQSLGFQDPEEAVLSLVDTIQGSVSTGEFLDILREVSNTFSMDIFANAATPDVTITKVTLSYNSPAPSSSPTHQPTHETHTHPAKQMLSPNGLIGVIVAAVFVFLIAVVVIVVSMFGGFKLPATVAPKHPRTPDFHRVDVKPSQSDVHVSNENRLVVHGDDVAGHVSDDDVGHGGGGVLENRYEVGRSEYAL